MPAGTPGGIYNFLVKVLGDGSIIATQDVQITVPSECTSGIDWMVTQNTVVNLTCLDEGDHPVHWEWLCYKVSYDDFGYQDITDQYCTPNDEGWCCENVSLNEFPDFGSFFAFNFQEDSLHDLEFYCEDALGNRNQIDLEYFAVETVPPETEQWFTGPIYTEMFCTGGTEGDPVDPECYEVTYIDLQTMVYLEAEDPEPHPSGLYETYWRNMVTTDPSGYMACLAPEVYCNPDYYTQFVDNPDEPFIAYDGPFNKPEESCHILEYYSVDNLENAEELNYMCFFADHTAPETTKSYEGPLFPDASSYPKWISSETVISLNPVDQEPHPSGVDETFYRVTLVDDAFCEYEDLGPSCDDAVGIGDFMTYSQSFNIPEESCHLIEYYSIDNVEKVEDVKKQCVFVDNTPPIPSKEVGEPASPWDGLSAVFYDLDEFCQEENACWKVTMTTPIALECADQDPHPVNHESVCFYVELDAVDMTEDYCSYYGGDFDTNEDGFCCLESEIDDFLFHEECEHNLQYYCIDALGNKGPIDDEKFKVEGTSFKIPLYKKWNLISVPFVLFNNDPDTVFKDLEGVDSVWTYDPATGEWLSWFPDNETEDTLTEILPGWGYWAFETLEQEILVLGGSLFSAGPVTAASRDLYPGWNLIGYYGTGWQQFENMEDAEVMCGEDWDFPEMYVYGDNIYCSLSSLIDTNLGFPRYSSLWSYFNCGDHVAGWIGHDLFGQFNRMYAGRGYWLELDQQDIYAPTSMCFWGGGFGII